MNESSCKLQTTQTDNIGTRGTHRGASLTQSQHFSLPQRTTSHNTLQASLDEVVEDRTQDCPQEGKDVRTYMYAVTGRFDRFHCLGNGYFQCARSKYTCLCFILWPLRTVLPFSPKYCSEEPPRKLCIFIKKIMFTGSKYPKMD